MIRHPLEIASLSAVSWFVAMAIDPTVVAAAYVSAIVATGGVLVLVIKALGDNQRAAREDAAKAALAARADAAALTLAMREVHEEAKGIAHSVDGAASRSVDKIDMLEQRVEQLIILLAEAKDTASSLAATTAAAIPGVATARAEGKAEGVEQERARGETKP